MRATAVRATAVRAGGGERVAPTAQVLSDLIWTLCRKQHSLLRHFPRELGHRRCPSNSNPFRWRERTDNLADRWAPVSRLPVESWHGTVIMRGSDRALAVAIKGRGPADNTLLSAMREDMAVSSQDAALYDGRFVDVLDPWLDPRC